MFDVRTRSPKSSNGITGITGIRSEPGLVALVLIVAMAYFFQLTKLPIRGEESRRANIAREMIEGGDWIIPRQQGELHLSRPPLQNWLIAAVSLTRGQLDAFAVRLPSVLATLLTTMLLYLYGRTFLAPLGALSAGASFATMGQTLELGRLGETEAVFALLVSASLIFWHTGYMRGSNERSSWQVGYLLTALGTLAKGPQGAFYFASCTCLFLVLRRDWRCLFSWSHFWGLCVFCIVYGSWQVPFYLQLGWPDVRAILLGDIAMRFEDTSVWSFLRHLLFYPMEVLACMLPWSVLFLPFLVSRGRSFWAHAHPHFVFLVVSILATFPTVWLAPGARPRYFMPMYPFFALLVGLYVDHAVGSPPGSPLRKIWNYFLLLSGSTMVIAGTAVLGVSLLNIPAVYAWSQPFGFALVYFVISLGASRILTWVRRHSDRPTAWSTGILIVAGFVAFTYTGIFINKLIRSSPGTEAAVVSLKHQLPLGHRLVSLGPVHHLFAFYYGEPIEILSGPIERLGEPQTYFCFDKHQGENRALPFQWKEIASISVDRFRRPIPQTSVVIGRYIAPL
jgi:4-amino-4-deoxy-L-arabinose transferase-like glycosyltransferase